MSDDKSAIPELTESNIEDLSRALLAMHQKTCDVFRLLRRVCEILESELADDDTIDRYLSDEYRQLIETIKYNTQLVKTTGVMRPIERITEVNAVIEAAGYASKLFFSDSVRKQVAKVNPKGVEAIASHLSGDSKELIKLHKACTDILELERFAKVPWAKALLATVSAFSPKDIFDLSKKSTPKRKRHVPEQLPSKLMPALDKALAVRRG